MNLMIGGVDVRRFGSQGQQRTAALSLKLAELELVRKISRMTRFFSWTMYSQSLTETVKTSFYLPFGIYKQ